MNLEDLTVEIRHINTANGWRDRWEQVLRTTEGADVVRDHIAAKLALIHSETSEALEVLRDGHDPRDTWTETDSLDNSKPEGFPIELADIVIRCLDLADTLDINLADAINWKLEHNRGRGHMHGGKKL